MVRPDLRSNMAGIPDISVPQETVDMEHLGRTCSSQGSIVLGNSVPRDGSELRPSTRIGNEKEITALLARRTHQERTLKEDWLVVDGNWRHTGQRKFPVSK
jgi:hypothetical protein